MNIHWIDWTIVGVMLAVLIGLSLYGKQYMHSVADFLAANRLAGRYLLTVSSSFYGVISLVALWEMIYSTGLPPLWWGMMGGPVGLFLGLTGFISYRFRQTRALTLAQFFEVRYSRKFRYFSAILCWISGILNYGIFPAVTANVFMYFMRLPTHFQCFGFNVSTFAAIMFFYLAIAVFIACSGGQITIMITDFLQGSFLMLIFVVIMVFLLFQFQWGDVLEGLQTNVGQGKSLLDPFAGSATSDFNVWYFMIAIFGAVFNARSWQGSSGYNSAAKTPHEAVISGVIGTWRGLASTMCVILIPLVAYAVLNLPKFAELAAPIHQSIAAISDPQLQTQMTVPLFLSHVLPIGLYGLFIAVLLGCAIGCDDTYMHAWGTIFIQDVVGPIRNKPFNPKTHMLLLRMSIVGVALFGFLFSCFFSLKGYIMMFFSLTGAIYLGGAGAVIIGGLYWKKGTTAAAWAAMIAGTALGFGGIVIEQTWKDTVAPYLMNEFPNTEWLIMNAEKFPINGQWIYFIAMVAATVLYISVSLLTYKKDYDLDKLLHRGKHAIKTDIVKGDEESKELAPKEKMTFSKLIGITPEFSKFERFLFYATFAWSMGWWGIFAIGTLVSIFYSIPTFAWGIYWSFYIWFSGLLGIVCTFWIFGGGVRDAYRLFVDLRKSREVDNDDGFIRDNEHKD